MHATVRSVIEAASDAPQDICLLDTEASPEHLSRGTARYADAMLTVVEPWFKSLETGRRMAALARDLGLERVALVANKVRDEGDLGAVREFAERHELELAGVVPYDERLLEAERAGRAPLDHAPDAPAVAAIGSIAREWVADGRA
jgi:CO dehydrogenase maturation factor